MELLKPTLFLLGGIGVINGMLLSAILLFSKGKKVENTFLGLLILMLLYMTTGEKVKKIIGMAGY